MLGMKTESIPQPREGRDIQIRGGLHSQSRFTLHPMQIGEPVEDEIGQNLLDDIRFQIIAGVDDNRRQLLGFSSIVLVSCCEELSA